MTAFAASGAWLTGGAMVAAGVLLAVGVLLLAGCSPPINDVTTDPADPPAFEAVLPARKDAPNPPGYGGAEVAAIQARLHPEVQPLSLACPPAEAFASALAAAQALGWEIVAEDAARGRIEATVTTSLMRFKDDVVVRLRPDGAGTRVDLRSKSRLGRGDLGTNARRIMAYLADLRARGCPGGSAAGRAG